MNKTSQSEFARAHVPASVWVAKPVPVDGMQEDIDSIRERIMSGQAFLKVVEYPWGVEFDVCSAEGRQ